MPNKIRLQKIIFFLFVAFLPSFVQAQYSGEQIKKYDIGITLNQDASINVRETIVYSFSGGEKHGIYRDIPVDYKTSRGRMSLRMYDISVADDQGAPYKFLESREGKDKRLRIGDPNQTVHGQKTYVISYTIKGAVNYFDQHDELYWNAIGSSWDVGIDNITASVKVPKPLVKEEFENTCFAGPDGTTKNCGGITLGPADSQGLVDEVVFSQDSLKPHENLTVVVGVPKGILHQPTDNELMLQSIGARMDFLRAWLLAAILPLATVVIMFIAWLRWGRDPKGRGTIITQFNVPDQLTPMEVGTLMDEKTDKKDISAGIIYLATKGYLKIKRIKEKKFLFEREDYVLQQIEGMDTGSLPFAERHLYSALFDRKEADRLTFDNKPGTVVAEIKISELKNKFYDIQEINNQSGRLLEEKGYYVMNPQRVRFLYYILGSMIGPAFAYLLYYRVISPAWGLSGILTAFLVILFGRIMPRKTAEGVLTRESLLGFREYLKVAEADRIKFHNAPEKRPELFEKFLPYAMVFGVEHEWAKQFEGIYTQPPGWYNDPNMQSFNSLVFINSLGSFSASAMSAVTTAAGGGSGFSGGGAGGGFGGGGGGSW